MLAGGLLALALVPQVARAALGEPAASVARDQLALGGQPVTVTPMAGYSRHEFLTASGTRVCEYVSEAGGTVFALTWNGPVLPDLQVLLAGHHAAYLSATEAHRGSHHALTLATDDLVLRLTRLPRGFTGSAHLPRLLPAGLDTGELR